MKIARKAGPRPVEEYFEEARKLGLDYLELGCEAPPNFPQTFDAARIKGIKNLRERYGYGYCLHSGSYVNSAEMMPTVRQAVEQHLIEYVQLAHELEADNLVVHLGFHFSQYMEDTYAALLKTYRAVVAEAERLRMPLVIENMNLLSPDAEIRYLGTTIEELKVVFDAFDTPYLGLALDVGHCNQFPGGVDPFIDAFGPRLGGAHLHDNDGVYDRHWPLGKGTVDWARLFARLKETGYSGNATIELRGYEDVEESVRHLQQIGVLPSK
jgi:sugar phosphate isomerase/epimerase